MTDNRCSTVYEKLNDQVSHQSPEARKDLTPAEHAVAEKLAADVRSGMTLGGKDIIQQLENRHAAFVDANKLIDGVKDRSRLDGILADANKLLSKDDEKLVQTDKGVVLGKQDQDTKDWFTVPMKIIDCESEHNSFQLIDRANNERTLHTLDQKKSRDNSH